MASLQLARKTAEHRFAAALIERGFESLRVKRPTDSYDAFVVHQEISLGLVPRFGIRHQSIALEFHVALMSEDFDAANGCAPFSHRSFRMFAAHSANFRAFDGIKWLRAESLESDVDRAVDFIAHLATAYPKTRDELREAVAEGGFSGLAFKAFGALSPDRDEFVNWVRSH